MGDPFVVLILLILISQCLSLRLTCVLPIHKPKLSVTFLIVLNPTSTGINIADSTYVCPENLVCTFFLFVFLSFLWTSQGYVLYSFSFKMFSLVLDAFGFPSSSKTRPSQWYLNMVEKPWQFNNVHLLWLKLHGPVLIMLGRHLYVNLSWPQTRLLEISSF